MKDIVQLEKMEFENVRSLTEWAIQNNHASDSDLSMFFFFDTGDDFLLSHEIVSDNLQQDVNWVLETVGKPPRGTGLILVGEAATYSDSYSNKEVERLHLMGVSPFDVKHEMITVAQVFNANGGDYGVMVRRNDDVFAPPLSAENNADSLRVLEPLVGVPTNMINCFADKDGLTEQNVEAVSILEEMMEMAKDDIPAAMSRARERLIAGGFLTEEEFDQRFGHLS